MSFCSKKLNNWQKNVPWLSHYEEVCRTSPFVAFEYRDTYVPSPPQDQPPMSTDYTQHEDDSRSYDPYLIAYHEDTNTFTYNDPWVEITHEDVCNSNFNENYVNEQNSTQSSLPTTTHDAAAPTVNTTEYHHQEVISSPQPQAEVPQPEHRNDSTNNNVSRVENPPQQTSSPAVVENVVEHVIEEVSLSRDLSHSYSPPQTK